jgi:hypothetical protein
MTLPPAPEVSTPPATKEVAQTRGAAPAAPAVPERRGLAACAGAGRSYTIGSDVERASRTRPYERRPDGPVYRPIRIFVLDPAETRVLGRVTTLNVPHGELFKRGAANQTLNRIFLDALTPVQQRRP